MTPRYTIDESPDRLVGNSEHTSKFRVRIVTSCSETPYLTDFITSKFMARSILSNGSDCRHNGTTFTVPVPVIIGLCAKKQMGPVYADRVVASVQNARLLWVNSSAKIVGNSMSQPRDCDGFVKDTIAVLVGSSKPWPAFIWGLSLHVTPESFKNVWTKLRDWSRLVTWHVSSSYELMCLGRVHAQTCAALSF